jgi:hypothetical protein
MGEWMSFNMSLSIRFFDETKWFFAQTKKLEVDV